MLLQNCYRLGGGCILSACPPTGGKSKDIRRRLWSRAGLLIVKPCSMSLTHYDLQIVAQVIAILNNDYKYNHSHARLANRFHISESKLRKIFKQANNTTINEFLTRVRIENAKELLCETDDPIKKIACNVGYDTRNLEKKFKMLTGMTPLEWKNKNRQSRLVS